MMEESINGYTLANTIRMWRNQYDGSFFLVEGTSDEVFFRFIVDHEACRILIGHGKHNVVDAIRILNGDGFDGALGVVDADFARIERQSEPGENLFMTEHHDLECLLCASPSLDRVVAEFGSAERVEAYTAMHGPLLGTVLARNAMPIGALLFISLGQDLGFDFEDLAFGKFVDPGTLQVNVRAMVKVVLDKSRKHDIDAQSLVPRIEECCQGVNDPWQISRGHDMICLLSIGLEKALGAKARQRIAPKVLERALRLAYHVVDFRDTTLYLQIVGWESLHTPYKILGES